MSAQKGEKLNWLATHLPEGLVVDAAWLKCNGYASNLLAKYLSSGWLEQPAPRVYTRPRGKLTWEQVIISLQTLLRRNLVVGGKTALELHGHVHYLRQSVSTVYLFGPDRVPTWLAALDVGVEFRWRNDGKLFGKSRASTAPHQLSADTARSGKPVGVMAQPWGTWDWPLMVSTPERALLEFLYELPEHESFHNADMLMQGLTTLSPVRLQPLLADCRSIKVKRFFFFLADRHQHAWLKRLDRKAIDMGRGKRAYVKGGRYDAKYMMTVPSDLDAGH